ncbi:MAG TPA: ankyrin repeat domain-containing protein [Firmicutes bacterium]|nr:ankyrin repeat domain-containing protein [Bacillota bacterium]
MGKALNEQLIIAIKHGDIERASNLIESGAEINSSDSFGFTPIYWAAAFGDERILELILSSGGDDSDDAIAGFMACQTSFSDKKFGSFVYAVSKGAVEVAKALLESGVDIKKIKPKEKEVLTATLSVSYNNGIISKEGLNTLSSFPDIRFLILKIFSKNKKTSGTKKTAAKKRTTVKKTKKKTASKKTSVKKTTRKKK